MKKKQFIVPKLASYSKYAQRIIWRRTSKRSYHECMRNEHESVFIILPADCWDYELFVRMKQNHFRYSNLTSWLESSRVFKLRIRAEHSGSADSFNSCAFNMTHQRKLMDRSRKFQIVHSCLMLKIH